MQAVLTPNLVQDKECGWAPAAGCRCLEGWAGCTEYKAGLLAGGCDRRGNLVNVLIQKHCESSVLFFPVTREQIPTGRGGSLLLLRPPERVQSPSASLQLSAAISLCWQPGLEDSAPRSCLSHSPLLRHWRRTGSWVIFRIYISFLEYLQESWGEPGEPLFPLQTCDGPFQKHLDLQYQHLRQIVNR